MRVGKEKQQRKTQNNNVDTLRRKNSCPPVFGGMVVEPLDGCKRLRRKHSRQQF